MKSSTASMSRSDRSVRRSPQFAKVLEEHGALEYSIIVAATASDPAPMQFLAPFSGCAIGEFFRDNGVHTVISTTTSPSKRSPIANVAAIAPPAGPRGLSWRRVLPPLAPARAGRQVQQRQWIGFAHRASHHRDAGQRRARPTSQPTSSRSPTGRSFSDGPVLPGRPAPR